MDSPTFTCGYLAHKTSWADGKDQKYFCSECGNSYTGSTPRHDVPVSVPEPEPAFGWERLFSGEDGNDIVDRMAIADGYLIRTMRYFWQANNRQCSTALVFIKDKYAT